MPKNLVFSFLLILLFPIFSFGQNQTRKEIKGKLLPAKDKMYLETVYVFNKQAGAGILSDSDGNFKLAMRIGDTIAVSAIHVADSELVIEQMHLNDAFITLAVEPSMEYLSEVRLSNRNLTGNLDLDMKRLPITKIITSADLGFPVPANTMTIGERKLNSVTAGPVELLVAALTGELKMIKRRIAIEKEMANSIIFTIVCLAAFIQII